MSTTVDLQGKFDTLEKLESFLNPLKSLSNLMKDESVVINIDATNKTLNINALNSRALCFLKYNKDLFDGFTFNADKKIGIMKLQEFVKCLSVIQEEGVQIDFAESIFSVSHSLGSIGFRTADPDMIKEGPSKFKGTTWYTQFAIDKRFSKLQKAMSVLSSEDTLFISGDSEKAEVTIKIRSSSVELNTFKVIIANPVIQNFETAYTKEVFQMILNSSADSINVSFGEKVAEFVCKSKFCDSIYYLAKKAAK